MDIVGDTLECGGSLIVDEWNRQWVLTAAHCINPFGSSISHIVQLRIRAGSVYKSRQHKEAKIIRNLKKYIKIHPGWRGGSPNPQVQGKNFKSS